MIIENGLIQLSNILDPLIWSKIFLQSGPIVLDLGAGDGGFAETYARDRRDINILAVERLLGRVRKIGRRATRLKLANLVALRLESYYLLNHLVPPQSVSEIHVLFPDPWPKKRHFERRIIQPPFLEAVARALRPSGLLRFTTDHQEYFEWALPYLESCAWLKSQTDHPKFPSTDFESEFLAHAKPIYQFLGFRRGDG